MKKRLIASCLAVLVAVSLTGCTAQSTATKAQAVIGAVLTVAQAEQSLVPPADQAAFANFVSLGLTLNAQLGTCIAKSDGVMGVGSKFGACFTAFATGLTTPAELAQLRVLSEPSQKKVGLYLTGIIAGVNIIVAFTAPAGAPPAPTAAELHNLGLRAGLSTRELAQAGL